MIRFILMGGTIDSRWDSTKDTAVPYTESVIPEFMNFLKLEEKFGYTTICMKDSREIENSDRQKLLEVIQNCKEDSIIVTHGTYTMVDTARWINSKDTKDKKIVFTGAMVPLKGFYPTDAGFNLGMTIGILPHINAGTFVLMNGKLFHPDKVKKNVAEGKFETVSVSH